ncbi:hypothetical protein LB507_006353 [Fusarium sp. FIESC RH6]|nr:hypothetical protein LB507_006353 [Fusarium sp. FIESC RH6]
MRPAPGVNIPRLDRRDDADTSLSYDNSTALEPVVPPEVDPKDFSIFELDTHVMLAWAGSPGSEPGTKRMRKRDEAIFSQANFTFQYPAIPLDHSTFVSTVTCTKGVLSGVISNTAAYNYAKSQWKGNKKIVFITSTDGCGEDHTNDLFLSKSITFADDTKTFTVRGSSTEYAEVYERFTLQWGSLGTLNVRRALDKRAMFEPHILDKRLTGTKSFKVSWERWLHVTEPRPEDDDSGEDGFPGIDEDAPWPNAAKLVEWGSEGGEPDDSYAKGEIADPNGHHKRGANYSLGERDLSYGLILYCVECGFKGEAELSGTVTSNWGEVEVAQVAFKANFKAGLHLGLKAFVKYEKEWNNDFFEIPLTSFGIPTLFEIVPYVGVGIEAGLEIEATGTLLIGASVEWEDIDILVDLLHDDNSHSNGLTPVFKPRSEATGELKLRASLGLPVSVGVKLNVLFDDVKGGVRDTPSVVLEGSFEANAALDDDGNINTNVVGDCYGIAWNIHFENALDAFYQWSDEALNKYPLIEPLKSDPIAEGCIGYVNDGTGSGASAGNEVGMSGNGLGGGSGMFGSRPGSKPAPIFDPKTAKTEAKSQARPAKQKSTTQSKSSKDSSKKVSSAKVDTKKTATTKKKLTSTSKKPQSSKARQTKATTTKKATATATKASVACTPSAIANTKLHARTICNKVVTKAKAQSKSVIGITASVKSVSACAQACLENKQCMSFGYNKNKLCQLYGKNFKDLGVTSGKGDATSSFYDRSCYMYSKCPK